MAQKTKKKMKTINSGSKVKAKPRVKVKPKTKIKTTASKTKTKIPTPKKSMKLRPTLKKTRQRSPAGTSSKVKTLAASPSQVSSPRAASPRAASPALAVGDIVASFSAQGSNGQSVSLASLKGQKVILYFYPKDDTPGCTLEGQEFNKLLKEFSDLNTKVYGISRDTVASHCKFIDKYGYQFELLSDENETLCKIFDVIKEKNMYGKKVMGIERSTFVIDENQKLIGQFRKIQAAGHAEAMLQFIKQQSS